ncbi:hypothetical protein RZS08_06440, partial [Arthrospira platensis SPKY1]|nr:hypothetical protein [Arthrospira platensis SPKY1]
MQRRRPRIRHKRRQRQRRQPRSGRHGFQRVQDRRAVLRRGEGAQPVEGPDQSRQQLLQKVTRRGRQTRAHPGRPGAAQTIARRIVQHLQADEKIVSGPALPGEVCIVTHQKRFLRPVALRMARHSSS